MEEGRSAENGGRALGSDAAGAGFRGISSRSGGRSSFA